MARRPRAVTLWQMTSYAVIWAEDEATCAGRLDLDGRGFSLHGRGEGRRLYVPYGELDRVSRDGDRVGTVQALRVVLREGRSLLLATIEGFGTLIELHEKLALQLRA